MRRFLWRMRADEGGQVAIVVAILLLALLTVVALVVNTGQIFLQRRSAQNAADSAALAGAYSLSLGDSTSTAATVACAAAALNSFSDGTCTLNGGTSVVVNIPPLSGPNLGSMEHVEVLISATTSATIVPDWGATLVKARAVAGSGTGFTDRAVFAMGQGAPQRALQVGNNGSLTMCAYPSSSPRPTPGPPPVPLTCPSGRPPGVAQVNSAAGPCPNGSAVDANASNRYGPPSWQGVGPTGPPGVGAQIKTPGSVCGFWPNATTAPPVGDPLAGYQAPDAKGCCATGSADTTNWCRRRGWDVLTASTHCQEYTSDPGSSLQPGLYTGVTLSGNLARVLEPGIYVFRGRSSSGNAGISIGGSGSLTIRQTPLAGTSDCGATTCDPCGTQAGATYACGVLLFFTYNNWPSAAPSGSCATFGTTSGATQQLQPEPDGPWQGWLLWYFSDPRCDSLSGSDDVSFGGNANLNLAVANGLVYAAGGRVTLNGNNSSLVLSQVVAGEIIVQQGNLFIDVGSALTPPPKTPPRLTE